MTVAVCRTVVWSFQYIESTMDAGQLPNIHLDLEKNFNVLSH